MHRALAAVLLSPLLASTAQAASPAVPGQPATGFSEEVEVSEVLVDVLVTDRAGNVILGLGPRDFEVSENGEKLEVTGATFYSNRRFLPSGSETGPAVGSPDPTDRRLFVLVFDDQSAAAADAPSLLARQMRAGRDARTWISDGLEPGDLVAVLSFDNRLELQQDFTANRDALIAAVDRAAASRPAPRSWPSRRPDEQELPRLADRLPAGPALRDATPSLEKALTAVADAAAPVVGRKNLILFTSGFGRVGGLGNYAPDEKLFRPMVESLNAGNVAVYVADLVPLGTEHPLDSSLSRLAADTGGRPFFDAPDFLEPLRRVATTTHGYYLVAFRAPHPAGSAGYQAIEVAVKNPEFRVTARRGYRFGGG